MAQYLRATAQGTPLHHLNRTPNNQRRPLQEAVNTPRQSSAHRGHSVTPRPSNHHTAASASQAQRRPTFNSTAFVFSDENAGVDNNSLNSRAIDRPQAEKRSALDANLSDDEGPANQHIEKRSRRQSLPADPGSETEDETPSEVEAWLADSKTLEAYKKTLPIKGRILGRYVDPYAHWPSILTVGLKRNPKDDPEKFTALQNEQYGIYLRTQELIPDIHDSMLRWGSGTPMAFGKLIQSGSKNSHSTDVRTIKALMPSLVKGYDPKNKHEMGMRHAETARLLCPADLDYAADLDYEGKTGLRQKLRDGVIVPKPVDLPYYLFHNQQVNLDDLTEGFFRSKYLVRSYQAIFISPSAADKEGEGGSGNKGNAARNDITKVSIDSIIYVAHIVHFVLSSQTTYSANHSHGFNYRTYCKTLKDTLATWGEDQLDTLLTWWNEHIFPGSTTAPLEKRPDGALSLAERMQQQAVAAALAAERQKQIEWQERRDAMRAPQPDAEEGEGAAPGV